MLHELMPHQLACSYEQIFLGSWSLTFWDLVFPTWPSESAQRNFCSNIIFIVVEATRFIVVQNIPESLNELRTRRVPTASYITLPLS